jgi:tol-pal system protein YbgF
MPEKDLKKALASAPAAPAAAAQPKDPQALYDFAFAAAQRGDHATAEKGFQDFLAKYGTHTLAGNASYWLGDIAYAKKDFGSAAAIFLEAYKQHSKHTKAPDMIYKAGSSFGQLGKKKEACTAFAILFKEHSGMPDRVKRAATAEKQKYECK